MNTKSIAMFTGKVAMLGASIWALGTTVDGVRKYDEKIIIDSKNEIAQKDSSRLNRLNNKLENTILLSSKTNLCKEEISAMRDSLHIDSLCKTAYFKGQQSIRDSIKIGK